MSELSSSMRRTWVEIRWLDILIEGNLSRPPCGGRGLKLMEQNIYNCLFQSSSMRRTWVEMDECCQVERVILVVLHAEDVG